MPIGCKIISMNHGKKILNSKRMIIFLAVSSTLVVSTLWFLTSIITVNAADPIAPYIQNVKHNSSHNSDLKGSVGLATILLQTDVINDSDCGSILDGKSKGCVNNKDMQFLVQVSDNSGTEGNLYSQTVPGSPVSIKLQVTTSDDSTKSNPDKLNVKFDGPNTVGPCKDGSTECSDQWFYNEPVSSSSCDTDKIWNGATIQCHLVIHYAWR
jgi:hypothetical protein